MLPLDPPDGGSVGSTAGAEQVHSSVELLKQDEHIRILTHAWYSYYKAGDGHILTFRGLFSHSRELPQRYALLFLTTKCAGYRRPNGGFGCHCS